jgi:alpha-L-arabinofuranosidase A
MGLGYFEYFQFCEDIGAEPLPVLAAGVPCQNSACHGNLGGGQQGGIPMSEMGAYIQDILDLIEWANGDAKKTKWGKVRAEAGHPKPFNLKYIGIGNEDLYLQRTLHDDIQCHQRKISGNDSCRYGRTVQ